MSKFYTIFIFLCAAVSAVSGQVFREADSLREAGNLALAAVEYERCAYQADSRDDFRQALQRKAQCYQALARYDRAAATVARYASCYEDYYRQMFYLYLDGKFQETAELAERTEMLYGHAGEDILLLRMLSLNELTLYDSAHVVALRLASLHAAEGHGDITDLIDSFYARTPRLKSENMAWWLSFCPGMGLAYAGEWWLGTVAFAINAAALGFGVWQVFEHCYVTAYMGGAGLLSATFPGQMHSAEYYVRKNNYRRSSAFNKSFKQRVIDAF